MCHRHVPGSTGLPVISEKSYDFYKDPIKFVQAHMDKTGSRIFKARFLNRTTIFVGTNKGVQDVLRDADNALELGYTSFMSSVYGDNILFKNGEPAMNLRMCLSPLFCDSSICAYHERSKRIVTKHLDLLQTRSSILVYRAMKLLSTELCISLFLNIDFSESHQLADRVVRLTTQHWHGIISFPMKMKVPLMQNTSYMEAMEAKEKLLGLITEKLSSGESNRFLSMIRSIKFPDDRLAANHILLFTSALIPKALASILTSFIITTGNAKVSLERLRVDDEYLNNTIKEVLRLHPAFIGGRRLARKRCVIDGYDVARDTAIFYLSHTAHRDPATFNKPDQFIPDRWKTLNSDQVLFNFGAGSRRCIGMNFINQIIKTVIVELLKRSDWTLDPRQDISYKWLPVSRPSADVTVRFTSIPPCVEQAMRQMGTENAL